MLGMRGAGGASLPSVHIPGLCGLLLVSPGAHDPYNQAKVTERNIVAELSPLAVSVLVGLPGWGLAVVLYVMGRRAEQTTSSQEKAGTVLAAEISAAVARESGDRQSAELLLEQTNALMEQMRGWIALQAAEIDRLRGELDAAQGHISELLHDIRERVVTNSQQIQSMTEG